MLHIAIAALLVFIFFKIVDKEKVIDDFASLTFVLAPAILIFLLRMGAFALDTPIWLIYSLDLLYFIVPALLIKNITAYTWLRTGLYAGVVFILSAFVQLFLMLV